MSRPGPRKPSRWAWLLPWLFCAAGLLIAFYPMLLSGFARVQADLHDTRMNHYVLEHGYLRLLQDPLHRSFWDPPIFYPHPNTAAYSDVLLGVAPLYWMWRPFAGPETSFQLWMLAGSVLNFGAAYLLLRRCFHTSPPAAAAGAFLFAFGSPRLAQIGHQQLLSQFYTVGALYAGIRVFTTHAAGCRWATRAWIGGAFGCLVGQLYSGYYLGWFLALGAAAVIAWMLAFRAPRRQLLGVVRDHWLTMACAAAAAVILLAPMLGHYSEAAAEVRKRHYIDAYHTMPTWVSWFKVGADNWLYGWANGRLPAQQMDHEQRLGIGFATFGLAAAGLWWGRKHPVVRLLALTALGLALMFSVLSQDVGLSKLWFHRVPGAYGVRVVSRIGLLMLLPAAVGLALFVHSRQRRGWRWGLWGLILLSLLEQGRLQPSFEKAPEQRRVARMAALVEPTCEAFFLTPQEGLASDHDIVAMWVGLRAGKPTVNGYSGNQPPGWPFLNRPMRDANETLNIRRELERWLRSGGVDPARVQWIRTPAAERP